MRPIDADALLKVPNVKKVVEYDETGCGMDYLAVPVEAIKGAPTLDYVPVIRCKDCDHADHHVVGVGNNFVYCNMWETVSYGNGYCHHSARNDV